MHDAIFNYFKDQLSQEEKVVLFNLIKTDATWRAEFIAMQNIYGLTSWLPADTDKAEGTGHLHAFKQQRLPHNPRKLRKQLFGYAAAILLTIACTSAAFYAFAQPEWLRAYNREEPEIRYGECTAPVGQRAQVTLHDGTTVWLNSHSTLRYPNTFTPDERRVELDGEAYFEVKSNDRQPFIVSTEKIDIKVTGTRFNVFAYHGQPEFNTSLLEGSVALFTRDQSTPLMELAMHERAVMDGNQLIKQPFQQTDFLLWIDGIYAFDDLPFEMIRQKLELYYDISIVVENPELNTYKFSGKFRQRDGIESVLHTLRKIKAFRYIKDDEKNVITIT